MKVLAFSGSPRRNGNTALMLESFLAPFRKSGAVVDEIITDQADIQPCRGCLRCNLIKRCVIRGDEWPDMSRKILDADILVFATPIYFHHTTASMKKILDRFRSFIHVQITRNGLVHTPWENWHKEFVLLTAMGSPREEEARPLKELFEFICETLGPENRLSVLNGTRLAVAGQIGMSREELRILYPKLGLPEELADEDAPHNRTILNQARELAESFLG